MIISPETKLTFKALRAFDEKSVLKIFLAGSIENGKAEHWQSPLGQNLQNKFGDNIIVFNPRRANWNPNASEELLVEQIEWELNAQEVSDIIIFRFDPSTVSAITLLELGLAINSKKKILVHCPKTYFRYTNVYETLKYHDMEHLMVDDLEKSLNELIMEMKNDPKKKAAEDLLKDYKRVFNEPIKPYWDPNYPWQPLTNGRTCSKCHMRFENLTGYVCNDVNCPTFFKVTC